MARTSDIRRNCYRSGIVSPDSKFLIAATCCLLLAFVACDNTVERAQELSVATLELDATYPEPFSYLSGVRELTDGKILAADPMSQVVLRLDLAAGTADTLGRHGKGPQEYEGPDHVFALPADSTLLIDLGNGRLIAIDPEGTFVDWMPMTSNVESAPTGTRTVHPRFVDMAGNIYVTAAYYLEGPADSTAIHRIDRATGVETPVASSWRTEYVRRARGAKRPMFVPSDDWAVGADGRVAVVRANGYSVDWYLPDGSVVRGPPNAVETFPVGQAEIEARMEFFASNAVYTMATFGEGGVQSQQSSRGLPPGTTQDIDDFEWPETLPVFQGGGTLISPQGEAWVQRFMAAGEPGRVDVFDQDGIRLGFIELPPGSNVIGFSARGETGAPAYLARTDELGLVWLELYRVSRAEE